MSSFYGDTTRLPMTPFYFDKIYTSKEEMEQDISNIFLNRYVLLKKENDEMIDPQDEQQKKIYVSGEVYQKQYIDNNEKFVLIASLTAPFTLTGDGGIDYYFNDIQYEDFKEINYGKNGTKNQAYWTTNNSQEYKMILNIPAIGNALIDIYNALAGLNTLPGDKREFNIIELTNGTPNENISLWDYPYHLAHEAGTYYIIMPAYKNPPEVFSNENTFNDYLESNIPIFIYDIESGYTDNLALTYDHLLDYYVYEKDVNNYKLISLTDFSNNIYGLIGYLNKLKDGEYPCDRNSLQGCINYANQIINQIQILTNLENITLSYNVINNNNRIGLEQNLSYSIISDGIAENKDTSDSLYLYGYNGISIEGIPTLKSVQIKIPKQNYTKYNKVNAMQQECCPINYSISYTTLSYEEGAKKAFEIYGCYTIQEGTLFYDWTVGKKEQISISSLLNEGLTYPIQVKNINIEYFSTSSSGKEYLYNVRSYIKNNILNFIRIDSSRYDLDEDSSVSYGDIYLYFHIKGTCEEE